MSSTFLSKTCWLICDLKAKKVDKNRCRRMFRYFSSIECQMLFTPKFNSPTAQKKKKKKVEDLQL